MNGNHPPIHLDAVKLIKKNLCLVHTDGELFKSSFSRTCKAINNDNNNNNNNNKNNNNKKTNSINKKKQRKHNINQQRNKRYSQGKPSVQYTEGNLLKLKLPSVQ